MRTNVVLRFAVGVLACTCSATVQAQAPSGSTINTPTQAATLGLGGTGAPKYAPKVALLNSSIRTIKGDYKPASVKDGLKVGPACVFTFSLAPAEKSLQANAKSPLRMNSDGTCEADFEIGQAPQELMDWAAALHSSPIQTPTTANAQDIPAPFGSVSPNDDLPPRHGGGPPGFSQAAGRQDAWFVDPVGAVVNSVFVQTTWWWYAPGTCVLIQSGQYSRSWLSLSGWSLSYENWINSSTCSYTTSYATDTFVNNGFPACLGGTVYAYYAPAAVWGQWDGVLTGQFAWSLVGPACINLLTPQVQLRRTIG